MNQMFGSYQLREAAGFYWLINMNQSGKDWQQPMRLNETGVLLLNGLAEGIPQEKLAQKLIERYELPPEEAEKDVREFSARLKNLGIL
jgi:hypothetical protein